MVKKHVLNAETELYCLIGKPVSHSLSPLMHNYAFRKLGLNAVYLAFKVNEEKLQEAVDGLKALNIKGANVTIPYKTSVIKYLDSVEETARRIGAVNTIKNSDGVLSGYNTDWSAAVELLKEKLNTFRGVNALIIGAGGVARAILYGLIENGVNVTVTNRNLDKAEAMVNEFKTIFKNKTECNTIPLTDIKKEISRFNIIINATPVGMTPNINETPVNPDYLTSKMIVFDTVYNPLETLLIKKAKRIGCPVIEGYRMLVKQGVLAFKIWTGIQPPAKDMERIVYLKLKAEASQINKSV